MSIPNRYPHWRIPNLSAWHDGGFPNVAWSASHDVGQVLWRVVTLNLLRAAALDGDRTTVAHRLDGSIANVPELFKALAASGGRLLLKVTERGQEVGPAHAGGAFWVGDHAILALQFEGNGCVHADVFAGCEPLAKFILDDVVAPFVTVAPELPELPETTNPVFMFVGAEGFWPVGAVRTPLCRDNYTPDVLAAYDALLRNLQSAHPKGRLALIAGPPGTGKTHLLYGLIQGCPHAVFILATPSLIPHLTEPAMLPKLLELQRRSGPNTPIVFLVEDGDRAIAERQVENLDYVQTLLGIGDGLPGRFLNLHMILTTNAGHGARIALDAALLRSGRMAAHLRVGLCEDAQARAVFGRLCPTHPFPHETLGPAPYSLASIYSVAAACGWQEPSSDDPAPAQAQARSLHRAVRVGRLV